MQQKRIKDAPENDYITTVTRDKVRCVHRRFLYCIASDQTTFVINKMTYERLEKQTPKLVV